MAGIRRSKKRDAIYETLCSTTSHPTADWIYARLKPVISDLSLGTVYRNLNLFKEEGKAVCVATVNGQERFDGNTAPHAHFICRGCGGVMDVDVKAAPVYPNIDARIEGYHLNFYGLCQGCGNKEYEKIIL